MLWKYEREPTNKSFMGRQMDFKSSPEYRVLDKIDGEPMEFEWNISTGFTTLQLCNKVQELLSRLSVEQEKFHWTDYLHVDVKTMKRMRIKRSACFSLCEEIFTRTMVIPRTWIRKEMVFYSRIQSTRKMGQSCGANNGNICRKQTPNLLIHESIIQRSAQEQRRWKVDNTVLCRW